MHKRFIVLLGVFLVSCVPSVAQTPASHILLAQAHIAPVMTMLRTASTPLPAPSFVLFHDAGESPAPASLPFAGAYERDQSLARLLHLENVKTLFFTQSNLPLVQLWGGRLQLDAFQSTLRQQDAQTGPPGNGGTQDFRPSRQTCLCGPLSVPLSGFSLSFHFGHDSRTGRPTQVWGRVTRFVGTVLN
jgi:hypothetical protein